MAKYGDDKPVMQQFWMNMGPFTVVKVVNEVAYQIKLPDGWRIHGVFHVSLLKPYYNNGKHQPPPPALLVDGEEVRWKKFFLMSPRARPKVTIRRSSLSSGKILGMKTIYGSRSRTCRTLLCHSESTGTGLQCKQLSLLQATAVG